MQAFWVLDKHVFFGFSANLGKDLAPVTVAEAYEWWVRGPAIQAALWGKGLSRSEGILDLILLTARSTACDHNVFGVQYY